MNGESDLLPLPLPLSKTKLADLGDTILAKIFSWVRPMDIINAKLACRQLNTVLGEEVWKVQCLNRMDPEVLGSDLLSPCPTYYAKLRAYMHAWHPYSRTLCSLHNQFTASGHSQPGYGQRSSIQGKIGCTCGKHAWELVWHGLGAGNCALVGISTPIIPMPSCELLGMPASYASLHWQCLDDQSWKWDVKTNIIHISPRYYGKFQPNNGAQYRAGDKIRMILDREEATLSFEINGEDVGLTYGPLPQGTALYPTATFDGSQEVTMVYLGPVA